MSDPKKSFGPPPPPSWKYVSGAPGIQSIPANSPGFPRSLPSFSSNLPISRLEHQISRIKWTFWAFLCYSLTFSQFFHKIRTFLFIYSKSPPLKHGDQIPHPLEDSGNQIPSSPGWQKCQMAGVCPRGGGGGACWSFDLTDTLLHMEIRDTQGDRFFLRKSVNFWKWRASLEALYYKSSNLTVFSCILA